MYLGSMGPLTRELRVPHRETVSVTFIPALVKLVDEILVNASDNVSRSLEQKCPVSFIRMDIDGVTGRVTVSNDGLSIPVALHPQENVYVPELIFGALLSGSNFNDSDARFTAGRFGYGAKLTNIFSREFSVLVKDPVHQLRFSQEFSGHMSQRSAPCVEHLDSSESSLTEISFLLDFERFGLKNFDQDHMLVLKRRMYDLSVCCPSVRVEFNDEMISVSDFQDYARQLNPAEGTNSLTTWKCFPDWNVAIMPSATQKFAHVSYVNSIPTFNGGTHVDMVSNAVCKQLCSLFKKQHKNIECSPAFVKDFLFFYVDARIPNPSFDSQSKDTLVSSIAEAPAAFDKSFNQFAVESGLMESIYRAFLSRERNLLEKSPSRRKKSILGITKLEDASLAGSKSSRECTLIITEGDSAKALAVAGLSVCGREKFGVFPIRGKLLNVRDANLRQVKTNQEIAQIVQALGLRFDLTYQTEAERNTLRYGQVMLMTDQDHDGSHIKGLFVNLIHYFWPAVLQNNDFLLQFVTPLLKAFSKKDKAIVEFYSMQEYEQWKQSIGLKSGDWRIKYYKGLGTSTSEEAKAYFSDLKKHCIKFLWDSDSLDSSLIEMAFSKHESDGRKRWIESAGSLLKGNSSESMTSQEWQRLSDFINRDLVLFSLASNLRVSQGSYDVLICLPGDSLCD